MVRGTLILQYCNTHEPTQFFVEYVPVCPCRCYQCSEARVLMYFLLSAGKTTSRESGFGRRLNCVNAGCVPRILHSLIKDRANSGVVEVMLHTPFTSRTLTLGPTGGSPILNLCMNANSLSEYHSAPD